LIHGLYQLWRSGKRTKTSGFADAEEFMEVVRQVVAQSTG